MLEGLLDPNHDYGRRLLAVDSKTPLQDRIDTDPGPTVDPICFVRPRDQEDQCDASDKPGFVQVEDDGHTLLIPDRRGNNRIDSIKNVVEDPPWASSRAPGCPCRLDKKRRGGDEGTSYRIDVVDFFPEDAL